jgi:hypothetical protein
MAQFEALLDRKTEERNRAQLNAGIVAAAMYNANPFREKGSAAANPLDFVPDYREKSKQVGQTLEEQIAILTKVMGSGPGLGVN